MRTPAQREEEGQRPEVMMLQVVLARLMSQVIPCCGSDRTRAVTCCCNIHLHKD